MTARPLPARDEDALTAVRNTLLDSAYSDAHRVVAESRSAADAVLARAHDEAEAILADAADRGRADAAATVAAQRMRARRRVRAVLLGTQREIFDDLRSQVVDALRRDRDFEHLCGTLATRAHALLGPDAEVRLDPDGGVHASCGDLRLDYALPDVVDQVLAEQGSRIEGLWR